eukprot:gene11629-14202_t
MALERSTVLLRACPRPQDLDGSLYLHLARSGQAPVRAQQHIRAVNAEAAMAAQLTADDIKAKKATPGDYPVAWGKKFGSGKVFYTSLGHREDVWDPTVTEKGQRANDGSVAKAFQQHVLGGILWSLGLAAGDATPQAK